MIEPTPDEIHYGCVIPRDLIYDVEADVWIRTEGDEVVIGMTDPAQTRCGKIVAVEFRRVGKAIKRGRGLATIESAKWVGPVASPVSGELVAVNEDGFARDILIANRDPYGEGWLVRIRPDDFDAERPNLQSWEEAFALYKQRIDEFQIRCFRCAD